MRGFKIYGGKKPFTRLKLEIYDPPPSLAIKDRQTDREKLIL